MTEVLVRSTDLRVEEFGAGMTILDSDWLKDFGFNDAPPQNNFRLHK